MSAFVPDPVSSAARICIAVLLMVSAVAWLGGCAGTDVRQAPLPPPPPLAATPDALSGTATQALHAAFGDREQALQCMFAAAGGGWRTACVSPAGQRVMTLEVAADGEVAFQTGPGVPAQLDPAWIAADIQLAFWPLDLLQTAQKGSGWSITEPVPATRRLRHDGRLMAEVHYAAPGADPWNGSLWISHYSLGYSLYITTRMEPAGGH